MFEILKGHVPAAGGYEPAVEPYKHQLQAAAIAVATGRLLLGDDLGMGKTFSCLLTLRDPALLPAIIVMPPNLIPQWERQIAQFMPMLRQHTCAASF